MESTMSTCSLTKTQESKEWPEAIISLKLTMNPYLMVMAEDKAAAAWTQTLGVHKCGFMGKNR